MATISVETIEVVLADETTTVLVLDDAAALTTGPCDGPCGRHVTEESARVTCNGTYCADCVTPCHAECVA